MLRWAGTIGVGGGHLRYAIGLSPAVRLYSMTRTDMLYDSSYDVVEAGEAADNLTVYALFEGEFWLRDPDERFSGPALLLMDQELIDGAHGRRVRHFLNLGAPIRMCQLSVKRAQWLGPPHTGGVTEVTRLEVDPVLFEKLSAAADRFQRESATDSRAAAIEIVEHYIDHGLISAQAHPLHSTGWGPAVDRIWSAFTHVLALTPLPSLTELGDSASRSPRQLQRDLLQFAGTMAVSRNLRWRSAMFEWRLKLAMTLLSAPTATPPAVARVLGYSSSDALSRAFTQAGFERPTAVREALRAILAAPPGLPRGR